MAPLEGFNRYVKTRPASATGRMMGRKKTVRKKVLNSNHRRVSKMATNSASGSLMAVSTTAKTRVFLNASQKIGSATIFW